VPLHWTIDSREQLVTITGEGEVTRADMDEYLDAVAGAGALAYRKLFDVSAVPGTMPVDDMLAVGARVRTFHSGPVGPLALVLSPEKAQAIGRILGILAAADRPMRIFTHLAPARRWIASLGKPADPA
jgi:hypothetical protein